MPENGFWYYKCYQSSRRPSEDTSTHEYGRPRRRCQRTTSDHPGAGTNELALVLPVAKGRAESAKELAALLSASRSGDYEESQKSLGITKESWFLSSSGDYVIVYLEGKDVEASMSDLIASTTPFAVWIKKRVGEITGVDWNNPPSVTFPRQILRYGYRPCKNPRRKAEASGKTFCADSASGLGSV